MATPVNCSRWVRRTRPGPICWITNECSPSKIPPGPTLPIQRSSRPARTASTTGVKVVVPVASRGSGGGGGGGGGGRDDGGAGGGRCRDGRGTMGGVGDGEKHNGSLEVL